MDGGATGWIVLPPTHFQRCGQDSGAHRTEHTTLPPASACSCLTFRPHPPTLQVWPRFEGLMRQPGAQDLTASLSMQLSRRFAARAIKFAFGAQQQLLGGGGAAATSTTAAAAAAAVAVIGSGGPQQQI